MGIYTELEIKEESILNVAKLMMVAARTAPKARGVDNLEILTIEGADIVFLSEKMESIFNETGSHVFARDSKNILKASAIVLLGTRINTIGLMKCGLCGFDNCAEKNLKTPCVFNSGDLGIAVGSAVSIAMDNRVDNRVMYSVGYAAVAAGLFSRDIVLAYGIPLSSSGKNPFFDRG